MSDISVKEKARKVKGVLCFVSKCIAANLSARKV